MLLIRSGAIEGFEGLVRRHQQNPIAMLTEIGLSAAQMRDPNTYVSYTKLAELLELAANRCNNPLLGLQLSSDQGAAVLGDLAITLSQYESFSDVLKNINKYLYLHAAGIQLETQLLGESIQIRFQFIIKSLSGLEQLTLLSMGQLCNFICDLINVNTREIAIYLIQEKPSPQALKSLNQLPYRLYFGETANTVQFPRHWLNRKPHFDLDALQQHFRSHLALLEQNYPSTLQDQVRIIIGQLLPSGECNIERVAGNLDLHPRVLQKRLKKQHSSFSKILQETRLHIAQQYLRHSHTSITELSLYLGYSDAAVFSRNFKLWTNLSPSQWQKRENNLP